MVIVIIIIKIIFVVIEIMEEIVMMEIIIVIIEIIIVVIEVIEIMAFSSGVIFLPENIFIDRLFLTLTLSVIFLIIYLATGLD